MQDISRYITSLPRKKGRDHHSACGGEVGAVTAFDGDEHDAEEEDCGTEADSLLPENRIGFGGVARVGERVEILDANIHPDDEDYTEHQAIKHRQEHSKGR